MSRSVGSLQALLTAILHDVFPEKGDVVLTVSSLRGTPSLDIFLDNGGNLEDALSGSGGAVDNVLSAGLRYSALMRTQNRRVMVMDEPDCWIKPDRVPAFISVLRQVSEEVGVQTLLVSHHDESFFVGNASLIKLTRVDGVPRAEQLHGAKAWESPEQPGIRAIRLTNFKAHVDTVIRLSPGMNALVGENDLGKSTAFVAALRAVAYGESDDTCLHHGAPEARITIEVENGKTVEWVRTRTGSPKVTYRVLQNGEVLHEGRQQTRGAAPDWVLDVLGIREVDGLDIQLRSQKTPVFLLDDTPSRRAQVLSVGQEASRLAELMEKYRELVRQDKDTVVSLGKRVARLRSAIEVAQPALVAATEILSEIEAARRSSEAAAIRAQQLETTSQRLRQLMAAARADLPSELAIPQIAVDPQILSGRAAGLRTLMLAAAARVPAPVDVPQPPLNPTLPLAKASALRLLAQSAAVSLPDPIEEPTAIPDAGKAKQTAARLRQLGNAASLAVPSELSVPASPVAVVDVMRKHLAEIGKAEAEVASLQNELASATAEFENLKTSLGVCPTCGGELNHAH
jgi:hypothetical protein